MPLLNELIDRVAEQVVMADVSNSQTLVVLSRQLVGVHRLLGEQSHGHEGDVKTAIAAVDRMIAGQSPDPSRDLAYVSAVTGVLQSIVCLGKKARFPEPPEGLAPPPTEDKKAAEKTAAKPSSLTVETSAGRIVCEISDPDLSRDFVTEAQEHIEGADAALLELEKNPDDANAIRVVFRAFHTVKGMSAFLDMPVIRDIAHDVEALLERVRSGRASFSDEIVEATFLGLDMLKLLVGRIAEALKGDCRYSLPDNLPQVTARIKAVLGVDESEAEAEEYVVPAGSQAVGIAQPAPVKAVGAEAAPVVSRVDESRESEVAAPGVSGRQVMRVDAAKVDMLLDMIGELVIAESIVAQDPDIRLNKSMRLERNLSHLEKITKTLQDLGMAMRMVPLEATFRRMARLVRDLARQANKRIDFVIEGQETEIDKGIVDSLVDPLLHMIRNAVDHGIERNEQDRVAQGKPAVGRIMLRAYHKGGNIHIEVQDDGRGLDRDAILRKGVEKGLVSPEVAMSDDEIFDLIFLPGFSTADNVTEVSGRGVGMDVVKTNVSKMRGGIMTRSEPRRGTTFTMVVPLTTAIIDGMLVKVGSEILIIPTLSIIESFRPVEDQIVSVAEDGDVIWFRDKLLPLRHVAHLLALDGAVEDPCKGLVVVVEEGGKEAGLLVDSLIGQQQTVIKSLGTGLGNVEGISGASIMADGRVGLILDMSGLLDLALGKGFKP